MSSSHENRDPYRRHKVRHHASLAARKSYGRREVKRSAYPKCGFKKLEVRVEKMEVEGDSVAVPKQKETSNKSFSNTFVSPDLPSQVFVSLIYDR